MSSLSIHSPQIDSLSPIHSPPPVPSSTERPVSTGVYSASAAASSAVASSVLNFPQTTAILPVFLPASSLSSCIAPLHHPPPSSVPSVPSVSLVPTVSSVPSVPSVPSVAAVPLDSPTVPFLYPSTSGSGPFSSPVSSPGSASIIRRVSPRQSAEKNTNEVSKATAEQKSQPKSRKRNAVDDSESTASKRPRISKPTLLATSGWFCKHCFAAVSHSSSSCPQQKNHKMQQDQIDMADAKYHLDPNEPQKQFIFELNNYPDLLEQLQANLVFNSLTFSNSNVLCEEVKSMECDLTDEQLYKSMLYDKAKYSSFLGLSSQFVVLDPINYNTLVCKLKHEGYEAFRKKLFRMMSKKQFNSSDSHFVVLPVFHGEVHTIEAASGEAESGHFSLCVGYLGPEGTALPTTIHCYDSLNYHIAEDILYVYKCILYCIVTKRLSKLQTSFTIEQVPGVNDVVLSNIKCVSHPKCAELGKGQKDYHSCGPYTSIYFRMLLMLFSNVREQKKLQTVEFVNQLLSDIFPQILQRYACIKLVEAFRLYLFHLINAIFKMEARSLYQFKLNEERRLKALTAATSNQQDDSDEEESNQSLEIVISQQTEQKMEDIIADQTTNPHVETNKPVYFFPEFSEAEELALCRQLEEIERSGSLPSTSLFSNDENSIGQHSTSSSQQTMQFDTVVTALQDSQEQKEKQQQEEEQGNEKKEDDKKKKEEETEVKDKAKQQKEHKDKVGKEKAAKDSEKEDDKKKEEEETEVKDKAKQQKEQKEKADKEKVGKEKAAKESETENEKGKKKKGRKKQKKKKEGEEEEKEEDHAPRKGRPLGSKNKSFCDDDEQDNGVTEEEIWEPSNPEDADKVKKAKEDDMTLPEETREETKRRRQRECNAVQYITGTTLPHTWEHTGMASIHCFLPTSQSVSDFIRVRAYPTEIQRLSSFKKVIAACGLVKTEYDLLKSKQVQEALKAAEEEKKKREETEKRNQEIERQMQIEKDAAIQLRIEKEEAQRKIEFNEKHLKTVQSLLSQGVQLTSLSVEDVAKHFGMSVQQYQNSF